jgi:hypothetical protein
MEDAAVLMASLRLWTWLVTPDFVRFLEFFLLETVVIFESWKVTGKCSLVMCAVTVGES